MFRENVAVVPPQGSGAGGAAVYFNGQAMYASGVTCEGNRVVGMMARGGCFNTVNMLLLDGSIFRNNSAIGVSPDSGSGGAIFFSFTFNAMAITNSVFVDNFVDANGNGGAIVASVQIFISNCTFIRNSAYDGGALRMSSEYSGVNLIEGCVFENNSAASYGGAIALDVKFLLFPFANISNCTFRGNSAVRGGGLHIMSASALLESSV